MDFRRFKPFNDNDDDDDLLWYECQTKTSLIKILYANANDN